MDIKDFLDKFGIDESSLSDKDRQKLLSAIQDGKNSIVYGVYQKSSADPISRKVFLDKYSIWKTNSITPQQLANEVTQGTVDKNIGKNMNRYLDSNLAAYMGYGEAIPSDYIPDPRDMILDGRRYGVTQMMGGYGLTDGKGSRIAGIYKSPDEAINAFGEFKKQSIANNSQRLVSEVIASPSTRIDLTGAKALLSTPLEYKNIQWNAYQMPNQKYRMISKGGKAGSEYDSYEEMMSAFNQARGYNPNPDPVAAEVATRNTESELKKKILTTGDGATDQPVDLNTNTPDKLNWNARIENAISDIKQGGMTSLGIGAGSIALSQMQGNGLVGTGVNLAGALGGSVLGNKYLGEALNPTVGRIGGGLAGHTIANLLMGLFRNPSEKQLLDQGMQYAQQQSNQPIQ